MNIQMLEAAKSRINIGTLIFKAKAVLSLLAEAMQMLFTLRDFFKEMKEAKKDDGVIDMEEFTQAIGPVVVQFSEFEAKYNRVIGGDSFKITAADMEAASFVASPLQKIPPKVIQPKPEPVEPQATETKEASEETTTSEAPEEEEEAPAVKPKKGQTKPTDENGEV